MAEVQYNVLEDSFINNSFYAAGAVISLDSSIEVSENLELIAPAAPAPAPSGNGKSSSSSSS